MIVMLTIFSLVFHSSVLVLFIKNSRKIQNSKYSIYFVLLNICIVIVLKYFFMTYMGPMTYYLIQLTIYIVVKTWGTIIVNFIFCLCDSNFRKNPELNTLISKCYVRLFNLIIGIFFLTISHIYQVSFLTFLFYFLPISIVNIFIVLVFDILSLDKLLVSSSRILCMMPSGGNNNPCSSNSNSSSTNRIPANPNIRPANGPWYEEYLQNLVRNLRPTMPTYPHNVPLNRNFRLNRELNSRDIMTQDDSLYERIIYIAQRNVSLLRMWEQTENGVYTFHPSQHTQLQSIFVERFGPNDVITEQMLERQWQYNLQLLHYCFRYRAFMSFTGRMN